MRIYLSGPISGTTDAEQRFGDAQKMLEEMGYEDIVNPSWLVKVLNPKTADREDYMGICLDLLNGCCLMVQLDGWQNSLGCQCEYGFARGRNIACMTLTELQEQREDEEEEDEPWNSLCAHCLH